MNSSYIPTGVCVFLSFAGSVFLKAQSTGPEFLDCNNTPTSLCVSDEGVTLPSNNKIYLGEENPNASSCSAHVIQKTKVRSTCGKNLQYEVQLFLEEDTSTAIILQPLTTITTDSAFEAELSFNSALCPDSVISRNGIPYTSGCNGYHRIKWIVTDSCGQMSTCDKLIELYDCSEPVFPDTNILHIITLPIGGQITVHLDTIFGSVMDDCTSDEGILYSFKPTEYQPDSAFNECNIPAFGVELYLNIWIADKGRDLNCDGAIDWSERNVYKERIFVVFIDNAHIGCGDPTGDRIEGTISTENNQTVEKVAVTLSSSGHVFPSFVTGKDGKFNFSDLSVPSVYTLNADRNDDYKNGVTTLDLVRIQKHLLGKAPFTNPYDLIAADANNSQSVSAIDLIEIRKLILGIYTEFPQNKSWRFGSKNYFFGDTLHPWPFNEAPSFTLTGSVYDKDFIGIKIGDVNNSVKANFQTIESRTESPKVIWSVNQNTYSRGDFVDVNFFIENLQTIEGFQFTVSDPDLQFIGISAGTMDLSEENIAIFNDKMTLSWFKEDGFQPVRGDILFTISAKAKRNGDVQKSVSINSDITEAEQYGMNDEIFKPVLNVSESKGDDHLILFAPKPNPWNEKTSIPFYIKESGNITFKIFDLNGQLIYESERSYYAGNNEINISYSDFTTRGLLYYCIKTATSSSVQKMIVLK